jgi:hypothetical protein
MLRTAVLLASAALALAACGAAVKYAVAKDVHAFIEAARTGDRATFDKHVDRPALRASIVGELNEKLQGQGAGALAGVLGPRAVDEAADRLISPEAFSFAAQQGGLERTPTAAELATQLRSAGEGRVCLQANGVCALTFADRSGVWKLVAVDTAGLQVTGAGGGGIPMQEGWPGR